MTVQSRTRAQSAFNDVARAAAMAAARPTTRGRVAAQSTTVAQSPLAARAIVQARPMAPGAPPRLAQFTQADSVLATAHATEDNAGAIVVFRDIGLQARQTQANLQRFLSGAQDSESTLTPDSVDAGTTSPPTSVVPSSAPIAATPLKPTEAVFWTLDYADFMGQMETRLGPDQTWANPNGDGGDMVRFTLPNGQSFMVSGGDSYVYGFEAGHGPTPVRSEWETESGEIKYTDDLEQTARRWGLWQEQTASPVYDTSTEGGWYNQQANIVRVGETESMPGYDPIADQAAADAAQALSASRDALWDAVAKADSAATGMDWSQPYWEISTDLSEVLGQDTSRWHAVLRYQREGDKLVLRGDPSMYLQPSIGRENVMGVLTVVAVAFGAVLSAGAGAGAAGGAGGAGGAGAGAGAGSAGAGISGLGSQLGTAMGFAGETAATVGNGIINVGLQTAANGGDFKAAVLGVVAGGIGGMAGEALKGLGVPATLAGVMGNAAGSIAIGQDPLQALINAGVGAGVTELTGHISGFKDLSPLAQSTVRSAMTSVLLGQDPSTGLINAALTAGLDAVTRGVQVGDTNPNTGTSAITMLVDAGHGTQGSGDWSNRDYLNGLNVQSDLAPMADAGCADTNAAYTQILQAFSQPAFDTSNAAVLADATPMGPWRRVESTLGEIEIRDTGNGHTWEERAVLPLVSVTGTRLVSDARDYAAELYADGAGDVRDTSPAAGLLVDPATGLASFAYTSRVNQSQQQSLQVGLPPVLYSADGLDMRYQSTLAAEGSETLYRGMSVEDFIKVQANQGGFETRGATGYMTPNLDYTLGLEAGTANKNLDFSIKVQYTLSGTAMQEIREGAYTENSIAEKLYPENLRLVDRGTTDVKDLFTLKSEEISGKYRPSAEQTGIALELDTQGEKVVNLGVGQNVTGQLKATMFGWQVVGSTDPEVEVGRSGTGVRYATPAELALQSDLGKFGKTLTVVAVYSDGYRFGQAINSGDASQILATGATIAGGWAGAYVGGEAGALAIGAAGCLTPLVAIPFVCAASPFVGGLIGGVAGYAGGSWGTDYLLIYFKPR